jgi:hypothetical protein
MTKCHNCKQEISATRCTNAESFDKLDYVVTHKCPVCGYLGVIMKSSSNEVLQVPVIELPSF